MDVKEKLVEIIKFYADFLSQDTIDAIADSIIAEGVTVQEWISVKDRLPQPGERVLVCIGAVFEAFIDDAGKWQRYYSAPLNEVLGEPTYWMPLPQPPKGE